MLKPRGVLGGKEDVSGIAEVHDALRGVDAFPDNVIAACGVYLRQNKSAVKADAEGQRVPVGGTTISTAARTGARTSSQNARGMPSPRGIMWTASADFAAISVGTVLRTALNYSIRRD